ncbi:MAG: pullulanase-type alpha-1,6-glucosidase [Acidobacteriota bacterium]
MDPLPSARAHWVDRATILFPADDPQASLTLAFAPDGGFRLDGETPAGCEIFPLTATGTRLPVGLAKRFPHLSHGAVFRLPEEAILRARELLRGELVVVETRANGERVTGVQIPGVLDDLFRWDGPLGAEVSAGAVTLRLWAPTARRVRVILWDGPRMAEPAERRDLERDDESGLWSVRGEAPWVGRYYLYEVEVYVPATGRVERNAVTDPWCVSLARNSRRSQILDLEDPALAPEGWNDRWIRQGAIPAFEDRVIYELHVRDFSAEDFSVPDVLRGTYGAFARPDSRGVRHLRGLAEAGLTHVQLLPVADFTTVDEDRDRWREPGDLSAHRADSDAQQAAVAAIADEDPYNWGYDPWHFMAPEGSYARQPDGGARLKEVREMVQGLGRIGLGVILDVVFNHTHEAGLDPCSVLDRVVPGYYHRRDADGRLLTSSCCPNTASEHRMMEKLMVDAVVHWARHFRVEGFRLDLMGHHLVENVSAVRAALDRLRPETDGVDGRRIQLLGEGWSFAEMTGEGRGRNASQKNLAGRGLAATFDDRLRDALRGGGPFHGAGEAGFATGLFESEGDDPQARLDLMDRLRAGLAGGLVDFEWLDHRGERRSGQAYGGYGRAPGDVIHYAAAHDNETFFDALQAKAPMDLPMAERVRLQNLALSVLLLAQGVPFLHGGMDLLRSKSGDRNSYNSGDWFNALDFAGDAHRWGRGLPPAVENADRWPWLGPLLADPALRPSKADLAACSAHCREMLALRTASPLFRLRSAVEVQRRLRFHNTGPAQTPGVVVMSLWDEAGEFDPGYGLWVAVFNARPDLWEGISLSLRGRVLTLHPLLCDSADERVRAATFDATEGAFRVPARTTAVFCEARAG